MAKKGDANQQGSYHSEVQGIHGPSWKLTFDKITDYSDSIADFHP